MDLQKEKHNYLAMLVAEDAITQEQCSNLSLHNGGNCFHSDFLASSKVDCINWGWSTWLKAKAQAIPEGFVLVPHDVADRCMGHISIALCHPNNTNAENDVMQMDLDILESKIKAQEQAND